MGLLRKIIRIRAEDSPNVRAALLQRAKGLPITGETLVPGVLSWDEYLARRHSWDKVRQCIGLDGLFYEGAETLWFPPEWLANSERLADGLRGSHRTSRSMGVDPAEGGDRSCWVIGDNLGVIELLSILTPDTTVIVNTTLMLKSKHNVPAENILFDRGGGGKQHADRLRGMGHRVRTVAFGESMMMDPVRGAPPIKTQKEGRETRYEYKNRRAQMYWELREIMDPDGTRQPPFAIPKEYVAIFDQLAPIPLVSERWNAYDGEGRIQLPPKTKKRPDSEEITLTELIGHSPDESDALVLMVHGLLHKPKTAIAGAIY